jgi:hypothetical protein
MPGKRWSQLTEGDADGSHGRSVFGARRASDRSAGLDAHGRQEEFPRIDWGLIGPFERSSANNHALSLARAVHAVDWEQTVHVHPRAHGARLSERREGCERYAALRTCGLAEEESPTIPRTLTEVQVPFG